MKKKGGFTLIEILIVVMIIGLLAIMGLGMNRSNLKNLKSNNTIEEIKSGFDTFFLTILNSSSYANQPYNKAIITLAKENKEAIPIRSQFFFTGENRKVTLTGGDIFANLRNFIITGISGDNIPLNEVHITFTPYQNSCTIGDSNPNISKLEFSILPKGGKEVCFEINKGYCRLESASCGPE